MPSGRVSGRVSRWPYARDRRLVTVPAMTTGPFPAHRKGSSRPMTDEPRFLRKEVRVSDPELSPEANRVLTEELQGALGTDRVELPREWAAQSERLPPRARGTVRSVIAENRLLVGLTFLVLLMVAVIVSITTGSWWALVVGCGVHAACT